MKLLSLISCLLFTIPVCAQQPAYEIFDSKAGKSITITELVSRLNTTDVLVFGEEHNDAAGHLLELQIFSQMVRQYPGTALSLEMFSTDVQPVIDEYLLGIITEKNFIREARAWDNYADYKPLIELARSEKAAVIGANAATRYSNAVSFYGLGRLNALPEASRAFLPPLPIDTATGRYHEKFLETLGGHDMAGMQIYQTQNLWDATMAWSVAKYAKQHPGRKILQLNGRFHSDEKLGMVAQLRKYAPALRLTTISCLPAAEEMEEQARKTGRLADYLLITQKAPGPASPAP